MADLAKKVMVNIVTWNSSRYLASLFHSFESQTSKDFSITVIDNASTDETQSWLQEHFPDVPVLRNFRNQGFAKAHNQGIALALRRWQEAGSLDQRYVFIANPDIYLDAHCIEELIAYMDAHPKIAIAGPKLYRAMWRADAEEMGMQYTLTKEIDSTGLELLKNHKLIDRGQGEEDRGQYDTKTPFGISGAAMIVRASCIDSLCLSDGQFFDEDFFAYKEDADTSWRARLFGFECAFVPRAITWHVRAASDQGKRSIPGLWKNHFSRSTNIAFLSRRNQQWLEWKNDDLRNRLFHLPWLFWQCIINTGAFVLFSSHRKAVFSAWKNRNSMKKKRLQIQQKRTCTPEQMYEWFV